MNHVVALALALALSAPALGKDRKLTAAEIMAMLPEVASRTFNTRQAFSLMEPPITMRPVVQATAAGTARPISTARHGRPQGLGLATTSRRTTIHSSGVMPAASTPSTP